MKTLLILVVSYLLLTQNTQAQITVKTIDQNQNPLVDSLVKTLAGTGVSISNISSNLKPTTKSLASFKRVGPVFPLSRGLLMSTGNTDSIPKPNRIKPLSTRQDYADTLAGNSIGRQLLQLILNKQAGNGSPPKQTEISSVTFDIIPSGDSIKFKYLFASEEYPEFVCSQFNDIFGFFIKGPGIIGDSIYAGTNLEGFSNMAKINSNNFPVSINTVNSGQAGQTGTASNCSFSPEGISNFNPNDQISSPLYNQVQFDGLTHAMHAKSKVIPLNSYTIVLAISDVGDRLFDSGIFIENGSLVSENFSAVISISENGLGDTLTACHPKKIIFKRLSGNNEKWTIHYVREGTAQANQDFIRRLPNGQIVAVPDSIVLEPNQSSDSLILEGKGKGMTNKTIVLKYLQIKNPYNNGQPNFTGIRSDLIVRPFANQPNPSISGCWNDSAQVTHQGRKLPHIRYRWLGLAEEDSIAPELSCNDCPSPKISIDTSTKNYQVKIENELNSCFRFDTVSVLAKSFLEPGFTVNQNLIQLGNIVPGYVYKWIVNDIVALGSQTQISFNEGDNIKLEVSSPNGCSKIFGPEIIFTSSIQVKTNSSGFLVFPNPAKEILHLRLNESTGIDYQIIDFKGTLVAEGKALSNDIIELNSLQNGLYLIGITTKDGKKYHSRFSKEN